ncbi:hypothetical protein MTO96_030766 [Rhipicephalus appendiculatus]
MIYYYSHFCRFSPLPLSLWSSLRDHSGRRGAFSVAFADHSQRQPPLQASLPVDPVYPPQPYSFGYDNVDEFGTQSYHKEQGDANNVKTGTYGYRDANGIFRRVSYVADANGFRATVDTNEPGTAPGSSADVVFNAKPISVPVAAKSASAPVPAYAVPGAVGPAPWSG